MENDIAQITKKGIPKKKSNIKLEDQLFFTLDRSWKELFLRWTNDQKVCCRCGAIYNEIENIGSWKCKQHALEWNNFSKGQFFGVQRWDCCGDTRRENFTDIPRGCVPCDHNTLDFAYQTLTDDVVLPTILVKYLKYGGTRAESILVGDELVDYESMTGPLQPDLSVIRRFKMVEYQSRKQRGAPSDKEVLLNGNWIKSKDISWYGI